MTTHTAVTAARFFAGAVGETADGATQPRSAGRRRVSAAGAQTHQPWTSDQVEALLIALRAKLRAAEAGDVSVRLASDDIDVELGPGLLRLLTFVFDESLRGHRVRVVGDDDFVSPEAAAQDLGVSRPFVYKLMDSGQLPFKKVGSHRRISSDAVQDFLAAQLERVQAAEALAREAVTEAGEDVTTTDLRTAARQARTTGDTAALKKALRGRRVRRVARQIEAEDDTGPAPKR
jgi:excisionase family DNA binding protein